MPSYAYLAREAATGRETRGVLDATTEQVAVATLLSRNFLVVSIQEKSVQKGKGFSGSVPLADLVVFTRQLATMVEAGLAIVQRIVPPRRPAGLTWLCRSSRGRLDVPLSPTASPFSMTGGTCGESWLQASLFPHFRMRSSRYGSVGRRTPHSLTLVSKS